MHPIRDEPGWEPLLRGPSTIYTRPLLGSEILTDQFHLYHDGSADVCHGLTFSAALSLKAMHEKLVHAMSGLRFTCPIIAANLASEVHDAHLRSWVYTPITDVSAVHKWAAEVVVVVEEPMEADEFLEETVRRRLPYVLSDGNDQLMRCYLLKRSGNEEGIYSLFLHGPHCIMDARPTLDLFWFIFRSISNSNPAPLENLEWGSEWKNLPAGPVVATGGPRPEWESLGAPAMEKIVRLLSNPVPTLTIQPQRTEVDIVGRSFRVQKTFNEQQTTQILQQTKAAGCTVTHLFEAAQMIAIVARNHELDVPPSDAHITYPLGLMSLAKYRVPPYNTRAQVISSTAVLPISASYQEIPQPSLVNKGTLINLMLHLKAQYDQYLKNPHFPHLTTGVMKLALQHGPMNPSPYGTVITNIGVVNNMIPTTWHKDNNVDEAILLTITGMSVGHRMTGLMPGTHVWTLNSKLTIQVQAADIWDKSYLEDFLSDIVHYALIILG